MLRPIATPPLQPALSEMTVFHSTSVTGTTDKRLTLSRAMSARATQSLISGKVTGQAKAATARTSTMNHVGAAGSDFGS